MRIPEGGRGRGKWLRPLFLFAAVSACLPVFGPAATRAPQPFSGALALKQAAAVTNMGPHPLGSAAHDKVQRYIVGQLTQLGLKPELDQFTASTPLGSRVVTNIIVRFAGQGEKAVLVGGHWDTKPEHDFRFVGANDGGSSTGVLLELARVLRNSPRRKLGVWLVFLDGEEAQEQWTATDSVYGSRHYAERIHNSGEYRNIEAVIIVDMIGDKNLDMMRDLNSTGWLNETVRDVAGKLGYRHVFSEATSAMEDDHVPFSKIGLPVVDLIDFNYGPNNSYWHTAQDTLDKISAKSLETVGRIVLGTIDAIGRR